MSNHTVKYKSHSNKKIKLLVVRVCLLTADADLNSFACAKRKVLESLKVSTGAGPMPTASANNGTY